MNSARLGLFLGVVVGCASLSGCGGAALKFNNQLSQVTKELESIGSEFSTAIKGGNPAELKNSYDQLVVKFDKVKAEYQAIKVPDTAEAKEFNQAFQEFMTGQETVIKKDFKEIIEIRTSPAPNVARLVQIASEITMRSNSELGKLRAAQAKFAKANNFKIK